MASSSGEFTLKSLAPGVYNIFAVSMSSSMVAAGVAGTGQAFLPGRVDGVEVRAGENSEITVSLRSGVMLVIQALDAEGRPVQGLRAGLVVEGPEGPADLSMALVDNPIGLVLPPGAYNAIFRVKGYREHAQPFEILKGDSTRNLRVILQQ